MRRRHASVFGLALGVVLLAACDVHPASWKTANMTPKSDRVQAALARLKPQCFGRFMIDLPEGTTVAWGEALKLHIAPGRAAEIDRRVAATEDERKKMPRYPLTQHVNLYFETRDGPLPHMKHVVSQSDFDSEGLVQIDTYFTLGDALVTRQSTALTKYLDRTLARVEDLARRLRLRQNDEIPTDAGQCIENGFVADRPEAVKEGVVDFIQVGFRLPDPADVHLSIDLQPANNERAKPGLRKRLEDSEADARRHGDFNLYGDLTTFRRAPREIHDWNDGFEFLTKTPDQREAKAYHDFWMIFAGRVGDIFHPYADIRMSSGVANNANGHVRPSITDQEAIALWDALTGTIRLRPVTAKTAEAARPEEIPIGTLAATGRACPRSGVWQCAEEGLPVQGGRRRRFRAGQTMPSAILRGEPSLWQRLKGEAPTHASPTVWKLVSLEEEPAR